MSNRAATAASQNGRVSGLASGAGIFRSGAAMALLPLHDQGGAAVPRAERAAGAVGEGEAAIAHLHLRMRLAPKLPDGLHDLGQPAPVRRMIVAEPAAVGVEGQPARARDEVAVGHKLAALPLR